MALGTTAADNGALINHLNIWSLTTLPVLNRSVLARRLPPAAMTEELNNSVLAALPNPESFSPMQAKQLTVLLGLWGASIARHHQEKNIFLKTTPDVPLNELFVGETRTPFPEYFARTARQTREGHPPRDAYASLVRWNSPRVQVCWGGYVIATLDSVFEDSAIRTYTADPGEYSFFSLIKKAEAVELAVNTVLLPLLANDHNLEGEESLQRIRVATTLLSAVHQLNIEFTALPAEQALSADHFLDVFRQFAVHWRAGDIPPSGAQDVEFLKRDFILGIGYPDYPLHVRRIYPGLLEHERLDLDSLMSVQSLPMRLLTSLGISIAQLQSSSANEIASLVRDHPVLAACYTLLHVNARVAASHLMLSKKYLFKPQRLREEAGVPDSDLVSHRAGTTGMIERLLEALAEARKNHVLRPLRCLRQCDSALVRSYLSEPAVTSQDLASIIRYNHVWNESADCHSALQ